MIRSLLVANRGEIAVRIIRTCREMGIRTVAVYSEADAGSLHTQMADEAVCIGPPASAGSYLNQDNLITSAVLSGCDAVHPGIGFLAENASFAKEVQNAGLRFIGPDPEIINLLGDKIQAKKSALEAGLPVIPGSSGAVSDDAEVLKLAEEMGFPLIVKAASGGGGRGMRVASTPEELTEALKIASTEALNHFSDGTVYLEKYIEGPRHVEIQLLSDKEKTLFLGERDCTIQKNHQKLLEETPSPAVTPEMRERMKDAGVQLFQNLGYRGAGTIEFLVHEDHFYFMEVNARVQVEHTVSEAVTHTDIIKEQIRACSDEVIPLSQDDVQSRGYSLECRINALSPGKVLSFSPPLGAMVRVDTFLYSGCLLSPHYDSLIAKVIVHAENREAGLLRMNRALQEFEIEGVPTNIDEQLTLLNSPLFRKGEINLNSYREIMEQEK